MGKKTTLLTLLLTLMLLVVSSISALAAPSPIVPDFNDVDDDFIFEFPDEDIPYSLFNFVIIKTRDEIIDQAKLNQYDCYLEELEKIQKFLEGDKPVIDYFSDDFKEKTAEKLPNNFDLTTLEMNTLEAAYVLGYMKEMGDVTVMAEFTTEYPEGTTLVAFAGIITVKETTDADGNTVLEYEIEWYQFEAKVVRNSDGELMVQIIFTEEFLTAAEDNPFILGIFSEKEE